METTLAVTIGDETFEASVAETDQLEDAFVCFSNPLSSGEPVYADGRHDLLDTCAVTASTTPPTDSSDEPANRAEDARLARTRRVVGGGRRVVDGPHGLLAVTDLTPSDDVRQRVEALEPPLSHVRV